MAARKLDVRKTIASLTGLLDVEVPKDATEAGFGKISEALAGICSRTMTATAIRCEAIESLAHLGKDRARLRVVVDLKRADLKMNNAEVKAGKNESERSAIVEVKLAKEIGELAKAEMEYQQIQAVVDASRKVLEALKTAKELAGHLLDVTQKEIDLGLITPATDWAGRDKGGG